MLMDGNPPAAPTKAPRAEGKHKSKARRFYKKAKSTEDNMTSVNSGKVEKKRSRSAIMSQKKAKHSFYQRLPAGTLCWHVTKKCVAKHLQYVMQKYPPIRHIEALRGLLQTQVSDPVYDDQGASTSPKDSEGTLTKLDDLFERRSHLPQDDQDLMVRVEYSTEAVDKIRMFLSKLVDRWLSRSKAYTLYRKAQTTTLHDFCHAFHDVGLK